MAYTNVTRDLALVKNIGSGRAWSKFVKSDGSDLGTPDTYGVLGWLENSKVTPSVNKETATHEGKKTFTIGSSQEYTFQSRILQRSKAELQEMWDEGYNNYELIIKELNDQPINGFYSYLGFLGEMVSWTGIELPGLGPTFDWNMLFPETDIVIDLAAASLTGAKADLTGISLTIPGQGNLPYAIVDVAA